MKQKKKSQRTNAPRRAAQTGKPHGTRRKPLTERLTGEPGATRAEPNFRAPQTQLRPRRKPRAGSAGAGLQAFIEEQNALFRANETAYRPHPAALLNPRIDANFKAIFTQDTPESRTALRSFLSAATEREVRSVTVIRNEEPRQFDGQRGSTYDINCVFADGTRAQVEMQGADRSRLFGRRAEYYAARLVSSSLLRGEQWGGLPQAYQISVLDFTYDGGNGNAVHHYEMTDEQDGAKLAGILNVIFLELPKVPPVRSPGDARNLSAIMKWCTFLKEADKPESQGVITEIADMEDGIMGARKALRSISDDGWRWVMQGRREGDERDRITDLYCARQEGMELGKAEGLQIGKAEGARNAAMANARNFLKLNKLSENEIALCCGLPLDEVLALKAEIGETES